MKDVRYFRHPRVPIPAEELTLRTQILPSLGVKGPIEDVCEIACVCPVLQDARPALIAELAVQQHAGAVVGLVHFGFGRRCDLEG